MAVALVAALVAGALVAQETTSTQPPPKQDSPLVKAAKASGGKRKSKSKVITNADVKKSTGKLKTLTPAPDTAATSPAADAKTPAVKADELYRARIEAKARADKAEIRVAELEADLRSIEQAYYAASDLNYRDTTIVTRFGQTKKQLDEAKKELADARDALTRLQ